MSDNAIRDFFVANHITTRSKLGRLNVQTKLVKCADGFTMSVQASGAHNCSPKSYLSDGDYDQWEVGYTSRPETLLERCTEIQPKVYGWVPTDIVNLVIGKHGGIAIAVRSLRRA